MKTVKLNGDIQYPDNDLQAKYDKLKESHERLKEALDNLLIHYIPSNMTIASEALKLSL